ncbi:MAG TPA: glycosyltransferase family 2 protein [Candidatus Rubrimentiphilum sp.]|nr:glycosyltransferase family 2 protein [Candidatus Rubrimentiphilum sp.]
MPTAKTKRPDCYAKHPFHCRILFLMMEHPPVEDISENFVTILVPARNEQDHIALFLDEVTSACEDLKLTYELLVIESGSSDKTVGTVQNFVARDSRIRLVRVAEPGYGIALLRGLETARGKYIVIFNVDFWDKRFLYLSMVDNLEYDIVNGSKLLPGSTDSRTIYRKIVSRIFNWFFLRALLGYNGTDTHGIKTLRAETVLPIARNCVTNSDIFDTELMVRSQRARLKMLELPVTVQEIRPTRFSGKRILRIPMDIMRLFQILKKS